MKQEIQKSTEIKWNPDGFHFLGPEESSFRRGLLDKLHGFFQEKGFLEVTPPGFDFSASFEHHVAEQEKTRILKTKDLSGREITPSLDLTVQVVKGMAGFASSLKASSKIYYTGRIFRDNSKGSGGRRETLQMGAEILGHSSGNTFKLLLSLIDSTLQLLQFPTKVTIVLGNMEVITSILEASHFTERENRLLMNLLYTKDMVSLESFLSKKLDMSQDTKELILRLALGFNQPEEIIQSILNVSQSQGLQLEECMNETQDLMQYVTKHLHNLDICLDFSLVRDMDYYTGFLFYGFSGKEPQPLVMGGAYDRLFEKFSGEPKKACGLAFQIDTLEELLRKDN
jgi:ATP phosphoribosyltransferase regulatory subunit